MLNTIILISIILAAVIMISLANYLLELKLKRITAENDESIEKYIFKSIVFICGGFLIGDIISSIQTVSNILVSQNIENTNYFELISHISIFIGIALISLLVLFVISTFMFMVVMKGRSIFFEIANKNTNAILIFSALMIALTFSIKPGLAIVYDALIPYQNVPVFR
jgi:hypothetical protein